MKLVNKIYEWFMINVFGYQKYTLYEGYHKENSKSDWKKERCYYLGDCDFKKDDWRICDIEEKRKDYKRIGIKYKKFPKVFEKER